MEKADEVLKRVFKNKKQLTIEYLSCILGEEWSSEQIEAEIHKALERDSALVFDGLGISLTVRERRLLSGLYRMIWAYLEDKMGRKRIPLDKIP